MSATTNDGFPWDVAPDHLTNRFTHHPPKDQATISAHEDTRTAALLFAMMVDENVPEGREKALAYTKIEEAMMWANAGIARA